MDSSFQALFSHLNVTNEEMEAILKFFLRRNEEKQAEIERLQQTQVENHREIIGYLREKIRNEERKSELLRQNHELHKKYSELQVNYMLNHILLSEWQRKNTRLESEVEKHKISCPVCLENFDTEARQPYALSCPHMVCAHCLYPALERDRDESRDNCNIEGESHPSKRCPVCRARVNTSLKKICFQP